MPHVVVEYSANVALAHDIDELIGGVHDAALRHGLAAEDALRTRGAERAHFRVGAGEQNFAFIAVHVRLGPGRDGEAISSFLEAILDAAQATLEGSPLVVMWSIECSEIDPEKRINRNEVRAWLRSQ